MHRHCRAANGAALMLTVLSAEHTLMKVLKRAKYLAKLGHQIYTTPAFKVFLYESNTIDKVFFNQRPQTVLPPGLLWRVTP